MDFPNHLKNILVFYIVGIILGIAFDFFRGIRKIKKCSNFIVILQDIIYAIFAFLLLLFAIYTFLDDEIRMYILLSIACGVYSYIKLISKFVLRIYIVIFKSISKIINFLLLPINLLTTFCIKIYKKIHKFVKKGCIKIINMINYLCKKIFNMSFTKQKKKVEYEKKSHAKEKIQNF